MIIWDKSDVDKSSVKSRNVVVVRCSHCEEEYSIKYFNAKNNIKRNGKYICLKCKNKINHKDDEYKKKHRRGIKRWKENNNHNFSEATKKMWKDDNYKKKMIKIRNEVSDRPGYRDKMRESSSNLWKNEEYRNKVIKALNSDDCRSKLAKSKGLQSGITSSIEKSLFSMLDDLGIKYTKHKSVGFYNFDCFLDEYNILIECQGEYWHSLRENVIRDRAKASYIHKNFPQYTVKYLWEHEFDCSDRVFELIKYWTGNKVDVVSYDLCDVTIREINVDDAKLFLGKYHYIGTVGANSYRYGAFLNDDLISVAVFGPVTRKEIATRLNLNHNEVFEFTRFCTSPRHTKKNLGSWFISKCIKLLKKNTDRKCIVSFADTTFNHDGALYKASNFTLDGIVKPSYWYVDKDGYVMHKKTLYNRAKKMKMKENDYAIENGYTKVYGKEKLRYLYSMV